MNELNASPHQNCMNTYESERTLPKITEYIYERIFSFCFLWATFRHLLLQKSIKKLFLNNIIIITSIVIFIIIIFAIINRVIQLWHFWSLFDLRTFCFFYFLFPFLLFDFLCLIPRLFWHFFFLPFFGEFFFVDCFCFLPSFLLPFLKILALILLNIRYKVNHVKY